MKSNLSFTPTNRLSPDPASRPYSDYMLYELLSLHEEKSVVHRLERAKVRSTADFLTGVIEHHENTAASLRLLLDDQTASGDIFIPSLHQPSARK